MNRTFTYTITEPDSKKTIACFLREQGYSRHILTHLKQTQGSICLNGSSVFTNVPLQEGDTLSILLREEASSAHIVPSELPFPVIYEDEDLLIVNKPANMPVHPSIHNYDNTLANAAAWYFQKQNTAFVYRCINRLDRDTTGLLILAKHMVSGAILSQMNAGRLIHREYLAIAEGCVPPFGTVCAPIARKQGSAIERCVDEQYGESAVTHFLRIDFDGKYSLVALKLETGRTHQIRVHMKHIGHPLPGDYLYNPDFSKIKRQALHSFRLGFTHPVSKKPVHFTAPVPEDFRRFSFHYENLPATDDISSLSSLSKTDIQTREKG